MSSVLQSSILAVLASVSLAGCPVPLPPGYEGSSRQNVPGMVPVFIKPAETSREDVMMHLGEPDAVAVDESWISYGSSYGYGGIALIMAAGGGRWRSCRMGNAIPQIDRSLRCAGICCAADFRSKGLHGWGYRLRQRRWRLCTLSGHMGKRFAREVRDAGSEIRIRRWNRWSEHDQRSIW